MQGSTLKQAQLTVVASHGRSMVTQAGLSGGKQQGGLPIGDVPAGQVPASGIRHAPPTGGCTHACCGPHEVFPQGIESAGAQSLLCTQPSKQVLVYAMTYEPSQ